MKASCPVNGNVCLLFVEFHSPSWELLEHIVRGKKKLHLSVTKINIKQTPWERKKRHLPTDPPVESWQNSNKPSKTGQSSPTLTVKTIKCIHCTSKTWKEVSKLHLLQYFQLRLHNWSSWVKRGEKKTHISASACCTQTCCLGGWNEGTWCSRHCGTWSFLQHWLYEVAKHANE